MKMDSLFVRMRNLLVGINNYLLHNIAICVVGNNVKLFDFTLNRSLMSVECTNQGLESLMWFLCHLKRHLHIVVMFGNSIGSISVDEHYKSYQWLKEKFGCIPHLKSL